MASLADDLATLEALNRGYLLAAEKSDVAWYAEHLSEDYRATNPDGSFVDKAGFLARIGRPHGLTNLRAPEVPKARAHHSQRLLDALPTPLSNQGVEPPGV